MQKDIHLFLQSKACILYKPLAGLFCISALGFQSLHLNGCDIAYAIDFLGLSVTQQF